MPRTRFVLSVLALLLFTVTARTQPPLCAVGYRSTWATDPSRPYHTRLADGTAFDSPSRPILINVWYPAEPGGAHMPHRAYLDIAGPGPLAPFASALADHTRAVITREITGADTPTPAQRDQLNSVLDAATICTRDAAPLPGSFPLVVYHPGGGSSFEDNAAMCAFLAGNGYVVVGSAFQRNSGESFALDTQSTSQDDLAFLIALAQTWPNVQRGRTALIGHSAGAGASLLHLANARDALAAVVSLDTTADYYWPGHPGWSTVNQALLAARTRLTTPILFAADWTAYFATADQLTGCDRWYLTLRDQSHNEFIEQGTLRAPDDDDPAHIPAARARYLILCQAVRDFLNSTLKHAPSPRPPASPDARLEHIPAGESAPRPYDPSDRMPPSPRQIRPFMQARGIDATIPILDRALAADPPCAVGDPKFGVALVLELQITDHPADAAAIAKTYRSHDPKFGPILGGWGRLFRIMNHPELTRAAYQVWLTLDPDRPEIKSTLDELDSQK